MPQEKHRSFLEAVIPAGEVIIYFVRNNQRVVVVLNNNSSSGSAGETFREGPLREFAPVPFIRSAARLQNINSLSYVDA